MSAHPIVRAATGADLDDATAILTDGFAADPVSAWLVGEPADRQRVLAGYFRLFIRHGLDTGVVHIADGAAVAVWFPHDAPDATHLEAELGANCGPYLDRFALFGEVMRDRHPTRPPHDYLMLLATTVAARDRGLGSALLAHRHAQLAAAGLPTYLEATTIRSADGVYRRAGYRAAGRPIEFPGGLTAYPLWRDATPARG